MNEVVNLWVGFSGRSLLYEVRWLVFYLCRKYCFGQCISVVRELCISQSGLDFFFYILRKF